MVTYPFLTTLVLFSSQALHIYFCAISIATKTCFSAQNAGSYFFPFCGNLLSSIESMGANGRQILETSHEH